MCKKYILLGADNYVNVETPLSRVPSTATHLYFSTPLSCFIQPKFTNLRAVYAKHFGTFQILSQRFRGLYNDSGADFAEGSEHVRFLIFSIRVGNDFYGWLNLYGNKSVFLQVPQHERTYQSIKDAKYVKKVFVAFEPIQ